MYHRYDTHTTRTPAPFLLLGLLLGLLALPLLPAAASAQETGQVLGRVITAGGQAVSGAQVSVRGLSLGAITDVQGRYSIASVPTGIQTIVVEMLGYSAQDQTVQVEAGSSAAATFRLEEEAVELEGVVVTALGISRAERSLGYAVQDVAGEELAESTDPNVINTLAGRVSGVEIKNQGGLGESVSITIRGASSIQGNNEPLIVVDGVPIDDSPMRRGNESQDWDTPDYGSALNDLNPDDIESISVLKGANAAALYGERAANGVVLITLKDGSASGNAQFTASSHVTWQSPLELPTYQNAYGGGSFAGDYRWVDGTGAGVNDGIDESWGPALDGQIYQQWDPMASDGVSMQPWVPRPYAIRDYWNTGRTVTTNFSAAGSTDQANGRVSFTRTGAEGMVPFNSMNRSTLSLNAGIDVTENLRLSGTGQYTKTGMENRDYAGLSNLNGSGYHFAWWQRQTSMGMLRQAYDMWKNDGSRWPQGHPGFGLPDNWNHNYWQNPFYIKEQAWNEDSRDRVIGSAQAEYQVNDWLSARTRVGTDFYDFRMKRVYPIGANAERLFGGFDEETRFQQETNTEVMLVGSGNVTPDLNVSVRGAFNRRTNDIDAKFTSIDRLNVPNIYSTANAQSAPIVENTISEKEVQSVYGLATIGFRDYLFLDITGRNDWSSTLPAGSNSYFYPSFTGSVVLSDLLDMGGGLVEYAKLRGSWARVGSDTDPYQLQAVYAQQDLWSGQPLFAPSGIIAPADLRPEITESWELGADLRFADQRAALDLTYYSSVTKDQIIPVPVSETSAFTNRILNAGSVRNRGLEVLLSGDLVRGSTFNWSSTLNFSMNRSTVLQLHQDLSTVVLGSYGRTGLNVEARRGEPYGVLYGTIFREDDQGRLVVDENGYPLTEPGQHRVGVAEPDFIAGIRSSMEYAGLRFEALVDWRSGGEILCGTCNLASRTGLLAGTEVGREEGRSFGGVFEDGTPNDIRVPIRSYWQRLYRIDTPWIYDASFVKLREVKFGFDLPDKWVRNLPVSNLELQLIGRNLAMWTKVPHIDPENDRLREYGAAPEGVEYLQNPTPASFGLYVRVTR